MALNFTTLVHKLNLTYLLLLAWKPSGIQNINFHIGPRHNAMVPDILCQIGISKYSQY